MPLLSRILSRYFAFKPFFFRQLLMPFQAGIDVSFGQWICVALPFCFVGILLSWAMLVLIVDPSDLKSIPIIVYERKSVLGKRNVAVLFLSLLCIGLFASSALTKYTFGDIGIVSLCYVSLMFGSGMLSEVH